MKSVSHGFKLLKEKNETMTLGKRRNSANKLKENPIILEEQN